MKNLFLITFLLVSIAGFSQNEPVNTDVSMLGNQFPQVIANNINLSEGNNPPVNPAMNESKNHQVPGVQIQVQGPIAMNNNQNQQVSLPQQKTSGQITINGNSRTPGYSSVSAGSGAGSVKNKAHKHKINADLKAFDKLFDKKFKKVHHYKKKSRIKRCASFS
ncbi:MAG TPA: hypothetical protein PLQ44_03285 [Candidatus Paceibacterota bacterium]|nr:hypothetical protein [Candidatus Paceibacterota bacterium]